MRDLIADIAPFWRYAVAPANGIVPGIPFYTRKGAEAFFRETVSALPWSRVLLFKRTCRGVAAIKSSRIGVKYKGN